MDFQLLPDVGRMNGRWPWGERTNLFAGSPADGERAAAMYTIMRTRAGRDAAGEPGFKTTGNLAKVGLDTLSAVSPKNLLSVNRLNLT
jgi:hypothetical protein